jgi:uncharacterized membrane protein
MTAPTWGLSLAYWLHMLATVAWIGGLAAVVLLVLPTARKSLDPSGYAAFLENLHRRFDPIAWLSLAVLVGTGLFQMSASANYKGFLAISNLWAAAILTKHLVFLVMTGLSAYLTWGVLPALRRIALLKAHGRDAPGLESLQRREALLLRLNFILGILVLGLTAIARAA